MAQSHLLYRLGDPFWFFPIEADGTSCLHCTEATTARADTSQDHEGGRLLTPALANIRTAGLLTHGMQLLTAHQLLELFVVFPLGGTYSQPFWTAFWNDCFHTFSLVLLFCESLMQVTRMVLMYSPTHELPR